MAYSADGAQKEALGTLLPMFTQISAVGLIWPQLPSEPLMTLMPHLMCLPLFSLLDPNVASTLIGTLPGTLLSKAAAEHGVGDERGYVDRHTQL